MPGRGSKFPVHLQFTLSIYRKGYVGSEREVSDRARSEHLVRICERHHAVGNVTAIPMWLYFVFQVDYARLAEQPTWVNDDVATL